MATQVMTLEAFAAEVAELAEEWEGDEPAVLIGDVTGSVSVSEKDGYSTYGPVAYAQECFDGNGVFELGQDTDKRFFGTVLFPRDELGEAAQAQLEADEEADDGPGGAADA